MRVLLRGSLVASLLVVGLLAAPPAPAAACEDPWSCLDGPSAYDLMAQVDAAAVGQSWGEQIHVWLVDQITNVENWFMQVPEPGGGGASPAGSGESYSPAPIGGLGEYSWD